MELCSHTRGNVLLLYSLQSVLPLLLTVADGRDVLEVLPKFSTSPPYLPVRYQVQNAELAFFLKEANQDIMRNSSLQSRTEPFFVYQARRGPLLSASYGPLSVEQSVPLELLPSPDSVTATSVFTFNWKVQAFVIKERIYPSRPKVQVLFYVSGRDWDDYSALERLPCVKMFAFHETQEVRGMCRLRGDLGLCVAELEPLAGWFSPPSVVPGRQRAPEPSDGTPVELYYLLRSAENGECSPEDPRSKGSSARPDQDSLFGPAGSTPMRRIGSVRLCQSPPSPPLTQLRLDNNFMVLVPSRPARQRDTVTAFIATSGYSPVDAFTVRVKLQEGVTFLGARPNNPTLWAVSQDGRNEGHRAVTLHCRRKEPGFVQRVEAGFQKVLQVDMEVVGFQGPLSSRSISWQVEYPGSRRLTEEVQSELHVAQKDLSGIVPLAMESEILNLAVLTGKTVAVPVKVVSVSAEGSVTDVSDAVGCRSLNSDVIKVSERCDYVYVNGKETRGRLKMVVNFTYSYLSAQLEIDVWIPRLPLQIELSDSELSQIRGWRVPITPGTHRSLGDSEDEEEEERKGRSCALQYQHATLRVLTHLVAEPADARGQTAFMLGSDWQTDVTELVRDFLKVEEPQVARLWNKRVLVGVDSGITAIQVLSPLSDTILGEKTFTVQDDKVTITELGVQLVSGLSLSLQLSPGSNRAFVATATTQDTLQNPKQEALISTWLQFSDGSMTPLDLYEPDSFTLSAVSLDETIVRVRQDPAWWWPIVVATEVEGQGPIVRAELYMPEVCQKSKRRSAMAAGSCGVRVHFGGVEPDNRRTRLPSQGRTGPDVHFYGSSAADTAGKRTTAAPGGRRVGSGGFSNYPVQPELPSGHNSDDDLAQSARGLSDLEIGMYALLGVFCLAILVFLINCVSYALKYRHKELSAEGPEALNHAHDWVWLGTEVELSPQREGEVIGGLEEGSHLLNGSSATQAPPRPEHKGDSPTSRRKRVKFTTFSTAPLDNGCPASSPLMVGSGSEDIQWVCQDVELADSQELRDYMERLSGGGSTLKDAA